LATVTKETTSSVWGHRRGLFGRPESGTAARYSLQIEGCTAAYLTLDVIRGISGNTISFCTREAAEEWVLQWGSAKKSSLLPSYKRVVSNLSHNLWDTVRRLIQVHLENLWCCSY